MEYYLPMQSDLLVYVGDWLLPLLEKQIEDEDIRQEKVKSELDFEMNIQFKSYQKKKMKIEKKFGVKSKKMSNFIAELNAIHGPVLARWKEAKQKAEAGDGEYNEEMAAFYQELIDSVVTKLVKYKLPIPPAGAANNDNNGKDCEAQTSTSQDNVVKACQLSEPKVIEIPVLTTASKNDTDTKKEDPIVPTPIEPVKMSVNKKLSPLPKPLTTTITPVLNASLNDSQLSTFSTGSKRRALAEINNQQQVAPRKTFSKKPKINDENVPLAEEKASATPSINLNLSKATEESDQSTAFFTPPSDDNNKTDAKTDFMVPGGDDNNSGSIQFDFSGSPFDLNTSFNLDMPDDDKLSNTSVSFDLGGFNMSDDDGNGSFPGFAF